MPTSHGAGPDRREIIGRLSRDPTAGPPPGSSQDPADEFCRLACLVYSELDNPDRWARARELLADHPLLVRSSIAAAACAADPDALADHLAADPAAGGREVGPHRWAPLMYLTYSRIHPAGERAERFLRCAQLLLDAGADPNAGFLWLGLTPPFTALTGVFGEGEQGAGRQPRHPAADALARLLLTAGADPNDGQALYNRMFRPDDSHLRLLFEFGLGRISGGPWSDQLGDLLETPAQALARQLAWAIDHGFSDRVELLIANGVTLDAPLPDGRTPAEHAVAAGYRDIIEDLRVAGVPVPASSPELAMIGALLAGDREYVADHLDSLPTVRRWDPALVHRARSAAAVAVVAGAGFVIDARVGGSTALHQAAFAGDLALIAALLSVGAGREALDGEYGATPLGWAEHACQPAVIGLLGPGTGR